MYLRKHNTQHGFTLIELMIVVVLIAIFATFSAPSMGKMMARQRVKTNAQTVADALNFAQSEAIRTGKVVIVQPAKIKSDGTLNSTTTWEEADSATANGLLVFADEPTNANSLAYDAEEDLLTIAYKGATTVAVGARDSLTMNTTPNKKVTGSIGGLTYISNGQLYVSGTPSAVAAGGHKGSLGAPGLTARIIVAERTFQTKFNIPTAFCRVVKVNSFGKATVCTEEESSKARGTATNFCYCDLNSLGDGE